MTGHLRDAVMSGTAPDLTRPFSDPHLLTLNRAVLAICPVEEVSAQTMRWSYVPRTGLDSWRFPWAVLLFAGPIELNQSLYSVAPDHPCRFLDIVAISSTCVLALWIVLGGSHSVSGDPSTSANSISLFRTGFRSPSFLRLPRAPLASARRHALVNIRDLKEWISHITPIESSVGAGRSCRVVLVYLRLVSVSQYMRAQSTAGWTIDRSLHAGLHSFEDED
ncbi:unnamed protein product [Mycena citricolor]|uniref:Uncharacterized protein n=1 Tax=Mycena citricolor TaxID=2018698 RepID=A0AAD2H292_9AGAR|nr:unnamed protein product [Mycena citricolor]